MIQNKKNKIDIPKTSERRMWKSRRLFTFLSFIVLIGVYGFKGSESKRSEADVIDCLSRVQISIDNSGFFVLKPANLLSGGYPDMGIFKVKIMESGRQDTLYCSDIDHPVTVMVTDTMSGNSCWSTVYVEDKLPPVITCVNDTLFCAVNPDSVDYAQYGTVTDNCDAEVQLHFSYAYTNYNCRNADFSGYTEVIWTATDRYNNSDTCRSRVYFEKPSISEVVFPSDTLMYCAIANPDSAGVPLVRGYEVFQICDLALTVRDDTTRICSGEYDINRHWTVYDICQWASSRMMTQVISIRDTVPPVFVCPDTMVLGTDPYDCSLLYTFVSLPASDACSPEDSITQQIELDGTMYNAGDTLTLDTGFYHLRYIITDDCGQMDTCSSQLHIVDDDAPILACQPTDTIGLGIDSIVIVGVDSFIALSNAFDNCGVDTILVRRMDTNCDRPQDTVWTDSLGFCCADVGKDVMVVIRAIDRAGNSNFCMINVVVIDTFPPTITFTPPDTSVSCTTNYLDTAVTGNIRYTDNCPNQLTVMVVDSNGVNSCQTGVVKRTFIVCDPGNNCDTAIQRIMVFNPYTFDTADVRWPADTVIDSCPPDSLPSTIGSMAFVEGDSCQSITVTFRDSIISDTNDACLEILRTWEIWDTCSVIHTHLDSVQQITLLNYRPPFLSGPNDTTVIARGCTDTIDLVPVQATDCSTNVTIENDYNDGGADASGEYPIGTTKVTFTATDNCGKTSMYMINVVVRDTTTPVLVCPPDTTLLCAIDFTLDSLYKYGTATFSDNCEDSVLLEVDTFVHLSKCNAGTVERRWISLDSAGNSDTCMQTITIVIDTVDDNNVIWPKDTTIADCPPDSLPSTIGSMVQILMNRCNTIQVSWTDEDISDPNDVCLTLRRTWTVIDSCSNTRPRQDSVQLITLLNYKPPLLTVPDDLTVYAPSNTCGANVNLAPATVTDCSSGVTIVNDHNGGGANASDAYDVGTTCVVFTATDGCGKQSMDTTCVTVLDTVAPILNCPPDTTVECTNFDPNNLDKFGVFSAMDNCDSIIVTVDTLDALDPCGVGMITRKWVVMDTFANVDSCTQTITVLPDTLLASDIICPPDSSDVDICDTTKIDSLLNLMPRVDSSKLGCAKLGISYEDSVATFCGEEFCKIITRKWTVIDSCVYDSSNVGIYFCTHEVRIIDTMPPTFDSIPLDTIIAAHPDSCSKFVRLKAHIWDCAGIKSVENDAPFMNADSLDISGEYPLGVTLVTFIYEDSCCNRDTSIVSIRILDTIPPELTCNPLIIDLSNSENADHSIEVCPSDFGVSSSDNCAEDTTLIITLNRNNPMDSCRVYNCDSLMGAQSKVFSITIYVIDPSNNTYDSCQTTLTVNDAMNVCGNLIAPISGSVQLMNGEGMEKVEMYLKGSGLPSGITDGNGRYEIVDIPRPGNYELIPRYSAIERIRGISTRDLIYIQRHLLGHDVFHHAEQYLAADINGSQSISTADILALRKIILGKINPFEQKSQWMFAKKEIQETNSPWEEQTIVVSLPQEESVRQVDLHAFLAGDIDFSSIDWLEGSSIIRSNAFVEGEMASVKDQDREGIEIVFPHLTGVEGLQFELVFLLSDWHYDGLLPTGSNLLCEENIAYHQEGEKGFLRISWSELNHDVERGSFGFAMKSQSSNPEMPHIAIPKGGFMNEAYGADGSIRGIKLEALWGDTRFSVGQNIPNPFNDVTTIPVILPEEGKVECTIQDLTGLTVWTMEQVLPKGDQSIEVDRRDIHSQSSVFIYTVKTKWGIISKKMVLIR